MKRMIAPLSAALLMCALPSFGQGIQVRLNGERVRFSGIGPQQVEGRVMVPLRGVLEQMGADVEWNAETQTVRAFKGDMNLRLPIGSRFAYVNDRRVPLDVPAMTMEGSTMVPLRFVSESLGAEVRWESATETVYIDTGNQGAIGRSHREYRDDRIYNDNRIDRDRDFRPDRRLPEVFSVTSNLSGRWLAPGDAMRVRMRATPDGRAFFRIRGVAGEMKMTEVSPGVYEGIFRNNTGHDIEIDRSDVLAFVNVGDRASAEVTIGGATVR